MTLYFNDRTLRWHRRDPETGLHPMVPTLLAEAWWAERSQNLATLSLALSFARMVDALTSQERAAEAEAHGRKVRQAIGAVRWAGVHKVRPEPDEHPAITSARQWGHVR